MASLHSFTTPDRKDEIVKRFKVLARREGGISKILMEYMEKYVKEHEESNNPQAKLSLFVKDNITACPNLFTAGDVHGEKKISIFLKSLNTKDYKEFDGMLNKWLFLANQENKRR